MPRRIVIDCDPGHDDAIAAYRAAIRLKPDAAEPHGNLGLSLRRQGKLDEAVVAFRRAAELAPPGSPMAREVPSSITFAVPLRERRSNAVSNGPSSRTTTVTITVPKSVFTPTRVSKETV